MRQNKKVNDKGISYPSTDDLRKVIPSKYKIAFAAARTAKLIEEKQGLDANEEEVIDLSNTKSVSSVGQALEEIIDGNVLIEFEEN